MPVEAQAPQALVIQGATLIDGNGGVPVANSVIVIQGNRIAAAGAAGQVQVPQGAQTIDARGKFVVPGLWDAQTNYSRSRYDYILNLLQLQLAAGTLDKTDLDAINASLRERVITK